MIEGAQKIEIFKVNDRYFDDKGREYVLVTTIDTVAKPDRPHKDITYPCGCVLCTGDRLYSMSPAVAR